ncbi:MAG: hypothetical protein WD424_03920 [Paenibacillaceae bacterium]
MTGSQKLLRGGEEVLIIQSVFFNGLTWLTQGILFLLLFIMIYYLSLALFNKHRNKRVYSGTIGFRHQRWSRGFRKLLLLPSPTSRSLRERQQLLMGCGLGWQAETYLAARRMLTLTLLLLLTGMFYLERLYGPYSFNVRVVEILLTAIIALMMLDKPFLESFMRHRRQRIVSDVYIVSRQLLYYSGSSMNLHTKLVRCLPYANSIRNELYMLTNEWYHNAAYAIGQFKQRIGTEEGYSFAETLNSLRQHESERYYELLRQRVQDYKEKLELTKEGRRETVSYLLFIMAGIPILFTFRLFVYPWVAEGQKLFESLG